jgi:DNA-binding XRE family transcriptional regulator
MTLHHEEKRNLVALPITDVIAQVDAISIHERESQIDAITDRSFAMAALLRQLALQKNELIDAEIENTELAVTIQKLIGEMGLASMISVGKPRRPTILDEATELELSERIRRDRISQGLTQTEYGEKYGVSRYVVSRAEKRKGDGTPRLASIVFGKDDS